MIFFSATIIRQPLPQGGEESGKGQGPEVHSLEEDSPNNSPTKKKLKSVGKDDADVPVPSSFRHVLDKGFWAPNLVDHHFINEDTKLVLSKISLEHTLPRVQGMLFHSATYVQDAEIETSNLRSDFLSTDKIIADANIQIQKLNTLVTTLQERQASLENKVKSLKEAKAASDEKGENMKKQVSELIRKIEELKLSVQKVECVAVDGVFDVEQNILDQIKPRTPDLEISEVDVFKKVVDGKVVSVLDGKYL
ncbi:hypothetical protein AHAS_Ahas15G0166800 [Arachis hypogaea]